MIINGMAEDEAQMLAFEIVGVDWQGKEAQRLSAACSCAKCTG